jgi:hypothetical protein
MLAEILFRRYQAETPATGGEGLAHNEEQGLAYPTRNDKNSRD